MREGRPAGRPLRFTGATVLTSEGMAETGLGLAGGRFRATPGAREVDLSGYLILPGIVDAHGDGFERHMAPRRGAVTDPAQGLEALEAELAANGITTAVLAQFWSWEGGMRGPGFARALCRALDRHAARADLRVQLRLELGCHAEFDAAQALIAAHDIGYVVINDHLPHAALARGRTPPRLTGQALKSGRAPADHLALLTRLGAEITEGRATGALRGLAAGLAARGVLLGSHDDASIAARAAHRDLGLRIAEFPLLPEVAAEAHGAGDAVVLGAPNVLRGGSHKKGGLDARAVVLAGHCDALASDYHYPAPFGAARALVAEGMAPERAWALISSGPARLLGLADRGMIAPGLRADLVVTSPDLSRVHATMAGGRFTHASAEIIERLMG